MSIVAAQRNGIHNLGGSEDLAILKKSLPHVDIETGLKNRMIKRDPISGLGDLPQEFRELSRSRAQPDNRRQFNTTLISWDADTAVVENQRGRTRNGPARNPITLSGDLGMEADALRTTSRPRCGKPKEPQRDPIAGHGNFGSREWDPIGKHTGRTRRAKSSTGERSNPLTGENVKTFVVMVEDKRGCMTPGSRRANRSRNVLTGEGGDEYFISSELKAPKRTVPKNPTRNTITGDNCQTYDFNAEARSPRSRLPVSKSNPLSGENVSTFLVSREDRPRSAKPYIYRNTLTGENVPSYKITPIERSVIAKTTKTSQNPLSGENVDSYTYQLGERKRLVKKRDLSSPLTGDGSRGQTYAVSIEERRKPRMRDGKHDDNCRNVLTGENCETYLVCQEMRSEKQTRTPTSNASYNILTGE